MLTTYQRKRKKSQHANAEMVMGQCYDVPIQPASSVGHDFSIRDDGDKSRAQSFIKVGEMYEIDHIHLPARAPIQLKCVRVAMVCEKTEHSVSVRFPSTESLRAFFSFRARDTHPALDEKFVMGLSAAMKALVRSVPIDVYHEKKCLETFWLVPLSSSVDFVKESRVPLFRHDCGGDDKVGNCLSNLNCNGMVKWGVRRQVKYLGRHRDDDEDDGGGVIREVNLQNPSSNLVKRLEKTDGDVEEDDEEDANGDSPKNEVESEGNSDDDDDDGEEEDEFQGEEDEDEDKGDKSLKRKRYELRKTVAKKPKKEKITEKIVKKKKQKYQRKKTKHSSRNKEAITLRNPKDRWSADRYLLAEKNLLQVMKSKGATAEKPIIRAQLRAEARKKIGDTGLLDHLLKHMAGKLAPGGKERFRRRHNTDGAMEYWLEDPNLINVRKEAGVSDQYWVPPQGWKPGDSPNQDPVCARELRGLREEVAKIRRDMEMMATKMNLEEEVAKLRRELIELVATSKKSQELSIREKVDQVTASLVSSKSDVGQANETALAKNKKQLVKLYDVVKEIEKKIGTLTTTLEQESTEEDTKITSDQLNEEQQLIPAASKASYNYQLNNKAEDKAAKIQRLKSGFRLCRPQGSFLWPNMVKNNNNYIANSNSNVLVHVEVPTPPSVTSSSSNASNKIINYGLIPTSPVKPVAERRGVKVTVSAQGTSHVDGGACNNYSTNVAASLINLNDAPTILNAMPMNSPAAAYGPMQLNTNFSSSQDSDMSTCEGGINWLGLAHKSKQG